MRHLHRSGVCVLALLAGAAALQFEPTVIRNLVLDGDGQRVTVGAVKVPLWSAAWAQTPETFALENVEFAFGPATYQAKRIEFSGMTSSRAEIEALASRNAGEPFADRLARINARQITIPDLRVIQKIGPETQATTYKNVVLKDVVQGRVGLATADATGVEVTEGKTRTSFSYGLTSVSELDLPAFARLFEQKAESDSAPLTRIHGAFSIEALDMVEGQEGVSLKVARVAGRDFMARTIKDTWMGPITLLTELGGKEKLSTEEEGRVLRAVADFLGAFDIGFVEATGFELKERPKGKTPPMTMRLARMAYSGASEGRPADARLEGLEMTDKDGRVAVQAMSLTGFSIRPTLDGLKALEGKSLDDIDAATARSLAPVLGTFRMSGLDIDSLNKNAKGKKPERVKATLKDFEFTADKPVNGVPTNMKLGLQNLAMELPAGSREEGIKDLLDLGYKAVDLSFTFASSWNEAADELGLSEVSVRGQDMGSLSLTGTLGNVTRDVFDADNAVAMTALMGAKAKTLDIRIENGGLFERYLAKAAKEQKTTPDALRQGYGMAAAVVIPSVIGSSEQAKALSQTIARFVAKPGRLAISAQAKDPAGLGIADIMALSEPAAAFEKLNVTAKAE